MYKILILLSFGIWFSVNAAVEDDLKASTRKALNKIDAQKEDCYKKPNFQQQLTDAWRILLNVKRLL